MFRYIVQPGDTLYGIAARFNVPINALMAANPGLYPYNLLVGSVVMVPATGYVPAPYGHYPAPYGAPGTPPIPGMPGAPGRPGTEGTR